MVAKATRWAVEAKALPSLGQASARGGPAHWRHVEVLQAEEESETWDIKHKRALRCRVGGSQ